MTADDSGNAELDVLLREALFSYREGLRRYTPATSALPFRDFGRLIFLGTIGWFSLGERLALRIVHSDCSAGLVAARQGHLEVAQAAYERAGDVLCQLGESSRLARLLGVSTYESGAAYMDFRLGFTARARERLERAMDAALELEDAGLPVMLLHRIQQGHNLIRMDLRMGSREPAMELAGKLLSYMEHGIAVLPCHRGQTAGGIQTVPRELTRRMIYQLIGETACFIVVDGEPVKDWEILLRSARLSFGEKLGAAGCPQVGLALEAVGSRLGGDSAGYVEKLRGFFEGGIHFCPQLWYSMMLDWVTFCRELNTRVAKRVVEIILSDSRKLKNLPQALYRVLHSPNGRPAAVAESRPA